MADRRFGEFLDRAKIHLLEDEVGCIDDKFYLAGRKDPDRIRKTQETRDKPSELLAGLDTSLPIFVIDHQPSELSEVSEAGADLDLGGHTHDGQLFPGNILTGLMWENSCGMKKIGDMYSIVTSGVGLWGPPMRIGTKAEVVIIDYGKCWTTVQSRCAMKRSVRFSRSRQPCFCGNEPCKSFENTLY